MLQARLNLPSAGMNLPLGRASLQWGRLTMSQGRLSLQRSRLNVSSARTDLFQARAESVWRRHVAPGFNRFQPGAGEAEASRRPTSPATWASTAAVSSLQPLRANSS